MPAPMSKAVIKELLKAVPLFADLSEEEIEMVASTSRAVPAKRGGRIFEEGAEADCCYLLTSGRAKLVLSAEGGTEIILGVLQPKELVGQVALLDHSARSADLIATEDCHFIRIPKPSFDALRRNLRFEDRVVTDAMALLRGANDQLRSIFALPSLSKVAWCLARLARREGRRKGSVIVIPKRPHQELAEMSGCQRETVTRAMGTLHRKKCIAWDDGTISLDVEALQRVLRRDLRIESR
jgi:CRP/FNR family transcriptional regulator, cyclic AMP receptor protein